MSHCTSGYQGSSACRCGFIKNLGGQMTYFVILSKHPGCHSVSDSHESTVK